MDVRTGHKFQDEWLSKALLYYQIIDQELYDELAQRYSDENYFFDVLVKNNLLTASDIAVFVENALQIPSIDLQEIDINPKAIELIPEEICQKYILIPFNMKSDQIAIASFNPSNLEAENEIEYLTGRYVKMFFAFKDQIKQKISEYYSPDKFIDSLVDGNNKGSNIKIAGVNNAETDSPVVKLVNHIVADAIEQDASDIHIEPKEKVVSVRFRIDGVLRNFLEVPKSVHSSLISRIKIISNLDIAETRKPQDGKAKIFIDDRDIDLRISILPTSFGEKVVVRILDKRKASVSFEKMGIRGKNKELIEQCFSYKQGMVLVTGPTGSGKSTTLYAALNRIRSTTNNILTIEDPIEYMMDGINQVQVNEKAGVTFATALRSFLRQDPDVILVGEIRDSETAEVAVQAALTGHLVLSTLHTNDTFATITRLMDMGVDVYKISESLQAIIAQRLVRKLCPHCRAEAEPDDLERKLVPFMRRMGLEPKFYRAKGCSSCGFNGYKGRIGVYEILTLDGEIKDLIATNASIFEIRKVARKKGFRNLYEDAISLIAEGICDYQEVLRVINPDKEEEKAEIAAPVEKSEIPRQKSDTVKPSADSNSNVIPLQVDYEKPVPKEESKKVLLVEDSTTVRAMVRKIIEKMTDWDVFEAGDGVKALGILDQMSPDVIVLDIMMPKMDGYEVLRHIRKTKKTSAIPVLVLTALNGPDNEVKGLEMGANDFLVKPYNPGVLIARLKRLLQQMPVSKNGEKVSTNPVSEDSEMRLKLI